MNIFITNILIATLLSAVVVSYWYYISIALISKFFKIGLDEAKQKTDTVLKEWWKFVKKVGRVLITAWVSVNKWITTEVPKQYTPDESLILKLMESVKPYSSLPMEYTEWKTLKYSRFEIPAIQILLICKTEENFPSIVNILKNVFKQHLSDYGFVNIWCYIKFQKTGENCYQLIILYAISDDDKNRLKELISIKKRYAETAAKNAVQDIIDDELEFELKGINFDEKTSKTGL